MTSVYGIRETLREYFELQAEKLLADTQAASTLTTHRGLSGSASEGAVRSFFSAHLPEKYGVGMGHIVSYNESSAQMDIIIYDRNECFKIPLTQEMAVYSVEGVYAAVEVKTSPSGKRGSKVIKEALDTMKTIHKTYMPSFSMISDIPTVSLTDLSLSHKGRQITNEPIGCVLVVGSGTNFGNLVNKFKKEKVGLPYVPRLFCLIDHKTNGLYGFDYVFDGERLERKFWREICRTPGEALAAFLYWLTHYMTFHRIIEKPLISNNEWEAIWPSALARIAPRTKIDVSEDGNQRSWPWLRETRIFDIE